MHLAEQRYSRFQKRARKYSNQDDDCEWHCLGRWNWRYNQNQRQAMVQTGRYETLRWLTDSLAKAVVLQLCREKLAACWAVVDVQSRQCLDVAAPAVEDWQCGKLWHPSLVVVVEACQGWVRVPAVNRYWKSSEKAQPLACLLDLDYRTKQCESRAAVAGLGVAETHHSGLWMLMICLRRFGYEVQDATVLLQWAKRHAEIHWTVQA